MSDIENIDDIEYELEKTQENPDKYKVIGVRDRRTHIGIFRHKDRVWLRNETGSSMHTDALDNLFIAWLAISKPEVLVYDKEDL